MGLAANAYSNIVDLGAGLNDELEAAEQHRYAGSQTHDIQYPWLSLNDIWYNSELYFDFTV